MISLQRRENLFKARRKQLRLKYPWRNQRKMRQKKQRGISLIGGLIVLAVVGFFLTVAFKIGPLYLDNSFVSAAVASLDKEDVHNMTNREIRQKLSSQFDINNIRDIDSKLIEIKRERTRTLVTLDYEKRINFMGNVDVVVMFKNSYDSSKAAQ